jgi:hypothetical protein
MTACGALWADEELDDDEFAGGRIDQVRPLAGEVHKQFLASPHAPNADSARRTGYSRTRSDRSSLATCPWERPSTKTL